MGKKFASSQQTSKEVPLSVAEGPQQKACHQKNDNVSNSIFRVESLKGGTKYFFVAGFIKIFCPLNEIRQIFFSNVIVLMLKRYVFDCCKNVKYVIISLDNLI